MIAEDEISNYENLRDCVSELVLSRLSASAEKKGNKRRVKGRKNEIKRVERPTTEQDEIDDAEELSEFVEVGLNACCMPTL